MPTNWEILTSAWEQIQAFVPVGWRSLVTRLRLFALYSLAILVLALGASYLFSSNGWLAVVFFIYLAAVAVVLLSLQTAAGAGLAFLFGVAYDRQVTEQQLRFLEALGKTLFWVLLGECFILLWFSIVPIWAVHPLFLLLELALWTYYALLCIPQWGMMWPYDKVHRPVFLGAVICTLIHLWFAFGAEGTAGREQVVSTGSRGISTFLSINPLHGFLFCAVALIVLLLVLSLGRLTKGGASHHG